MAAGVRLVMTPLLVLAVLVLYGDLVLPMRVESEEPQP
jgi:hypothetical protein